MTPEKWARIKRLFDELEALPSRDRRHALDTLAKNDLDIREDVQRLLDHVDAPETLIDRRAVALLDATEPVSEDTNPGSPRFTITREVGTGGMGIVYEAHDTLLGSRVALKTLHHFRPEYIDLLKGEFRSLAQINHPNLVTLFDLFAHGRQWFFTMEFIDGRDFVRCVEDSVGGSSDAARRVRLRPLFAALAQGVHFLHTCGKLHRDLKPSNVMVTEEGRVVILDFGLVSDLHGTAVGLGVHAGTIPYMSPEQARGEQLTEASDWYSLGVMLHQCLTGSLPPAAVRFERLAPAVTGSEQLDDLCTDLLRFRPEDRPRGTEVLARLGSGTSASLDVVTWRPAQSDQPIVGRHAEFSVLNSAAARLANGTPAIVFVEGPSGVGKSALLRHFATALAKAPNTTVLESRCYEREFVAFNVFDSMMDGVNRYLRSLTAAARDAVLPFDIVALSRMFPALEWLAYDAPHPPPVDQLQLRRAASGALRELLVNLGRSTRLVILADDVQWGDADSAAMLQELFRDVDPPNVLFVVAYRTDNRAMSACLRLLLDGPDDGREVRCGNALNGETGGLERLHVQLAPLELDLATSLAASLLRRSRAHGDTHYAEAIARESRGNPYFIHELTEHAAGASQSDGPRFSADSLTLPAVIKARTEHLPEPAHRLLEIVAMSGRPIRTADAVDAAALDEGGSTWLALLRTQHFISRVATDQHDYIEPYHDGLRETIVASIPSDRRRDRHASLASTLERSGLADADVVAVHYEGAGDNNAAARLYAVAAGQAAHALAFHTAADLYQRVLALGTFSQAERNVTLRSLAEALANTGRTFDAAAVFEEAAAEQSHDGVVSLTRAGYHYASSGHVEEAKTAFAAAITRLRLHVPLRARPAVPALLAVRALLMFHGFRFQERPSDLADPQEVAKIDMCWFVGTGLGLVDLMTGAVFTSYALYLALKSGDPLRVARGLTWEAAIAASQSRRGKQHAERLFAICRGLVERLNDPYASAMLLLTEGQADFSHGRWTPALEKFGRAADVFRTRCTGVSFELATLEGFRLQTHVYSGNYQALRVAAPELLDAAQGSGDLYLETFIRGAIQPLVWLAEDRVDQAEMFVATALERWSAPGYHLQHALIDQVRLWIELYVGRADAAVAIIDRQWPLLRQSHLLYNQNLRAKMLELRARCFVAVAAQDREAGHLKRADRAVRDLEREREPYFSGSVLSMRAVLCRCRGDVQEARAVMGAAQIAFEQWDMRDYDAAARLTLSEWMGGDESIRDEALAWMDAQGIRDPMRWTCMRIPWK